MLRKHAHRLVLVLLVAVFASAPCLSEPAPPPTSAPPPASVDPQLQADTASYKQAVAIYNAGDHAKAFAIWKPLADKKYIGAMVLVGLMDLEGDGTPKDPTAALSIFTEGANDGDVRSQVLLGYMYLTATAVNYDYAAYTKWMDLAFQQDPSQAADTLGVDLFVGHPRQEGAFALYLSDKAAQQKDPSDLYAKAYPFANDSSAKGDMFGEYALGDLYYYGEGVEKDQVKAAALFKASADQGFMLGQNNLGAMYENGTGVPRDYDEARRLYLLAARQGYGRSESNLCKMYATGTGVPVDSVEAYMWCNLAAAQGETDASQALDALQAAMTTAQIATAQKRSQEFLASISSGHTPASSADDVKSAQRRLARLGYYKGKADGVLGNGTTEAISTFEKDHGLPVDGEITSPLLAALESASSAVSARPAAGRGMTLRSTGTGFYVNGTGYLITNAHVIDGCAEVRASTGNDTATLTLKAEDVADDLALLAHKGPVPSVAEFRDGGALQVGEHLVVFGFPLPDVLSGQLTLTDGSVSALGGLGGSVQQFQFSAPIQPGNSGGPILDAAGRVVGISVAKLNALAVTKAIGDVPQNVNFGINEQTIRAFLDLHSVRYSLDKAANAVPEPTMATEAKDYTVLLESWK